MSKRCSRVGRESETSAAPIVRTMRASARDALTEADLDATRSHKRGPGPPSQSGAPWLRGR